LRFDDLARFSEVMRPPLSSSHHLYPNFLNSKEEKSYKITVSIIKIDEPTRKKGKNSQVKQNIETELGMDAY
jgi:hypothetical protein